MKFQRSSGILLHPTSLPGPYGIGELGAEAYRFVDFLQETGQHLWQVLPLGPVGYGNSPYQSPSTFAGNVLLVSFERLQEDGWLPQEALDQRPQFPADHVDFEAVRAWKVPLLAEASRRFLERASPAQREEYEIFCRQHAGWLEDYALFRALKTHFGGQTWTEWEPGLAFRDPSALDAARWELAAEIDARKFGQFQFFRQWRDLHAYCRERGVKIIGDVPIYVAHDSADVWAHRELFKLDEAGKPTVVAGVPPDYFSATGQLWGNPIYHWDRMSATKYQWWIERVSVNLELFDAMRLDHFRGFEAFWQVASAEATAENGEWIRGPEDEIFDALKQKLGDELPFIAEDLGVITPAVVALRERAGLVGMAVLQFGLGNNPGDSACPPHRYTRDLVAYTGTHDNETIAGWARRLQEQEPWRWEYVHNYLAVNGQPFHWASIRSLMASVADVVVFPLQDVLGIDNAARMNRPGEVGANWEWRFQADLLHQDVRAKLRELTHLYGRLP